MKHGDQRLLGTLAYATPVASTLLLCAAGYAPPSYVASQGTQLQRRGRIYIDQLDDQIWVGGDTVVAVTGSVDL